MGTKNLDNSILARYLSKECTDEERRQVKKWLQKDSANKHKLEEFKYIWEKPQKVTIPT